MHHYIALVADDENEESVRALRGTGEALLETNSDWIVSHRDSGSLVLHASAGSAAANVYRFQDDYGVVYGALFRRDWINGSPGSSVVFNDVETGRVIGSEGKHLIDSYWGNYVAFFRGRDRREFHVIRDPTANMPCYHARWRGVDIFFSHVEDVVPLIPLSINWVYLTLCLLVHLRSTRECGLKEVEDIPGGERVTLARGGISRTALWNPARFCEEPLTDESRASRALRGTVQGVVSAWSSVFSDVVLKLSGGLDSSIIAGCLASAPAAPTVTCLNFFMRSDAPYVPQAIPSLSTQHVEKIRRALVHADERKFAKLVAERWGYRLIEQERNVHDIDLARAWDAPLSVHPSSFSSCSDVDDAEIAAVQGSRAQAMFSGLGGDSVFYATLHPIGAVDYAYQRRFDSRFIGQILAASALSKESVWSVLHKSIRYGVLRRAMPEAYDPRKRPHLLRDRCANSITLASAVHPWVALSTHLPPGKFEHVTGIAHSALFYLQEFRRQRYAPSINPLTAQPVVECSLGIATYTLLAGGVSRGLTRRAFADVLPSAIRSRTVKGSGSPFYQELMQKNIRFLRESLADGVLAREGLLDRQKLLSYLVEGQPFLTVHESQIRTYLAIEARARRWTTVQQRIAA